MSHPIESPQRSHDEPKYVTCWGNVVAVAVLSSIVVVVLGTLWISSVLSKDQSNELAIETPFDTYENPAEKTRHDQDRREVDGSDRDSPGVTDLAPWSDVPMERTLVRSVEDDDEKSSDSRLAPVPTVAMQIFDEDVREFFELLDEPPLDFVQARDDRSPDKTASWTDWSEPVGEADLLHYLDSTVARVNIDADSSTRQRLLASVESQSKAETSNIGPDRPIAKSQEPTTILHLLKERADLAGLPVRQGEACQIDPEAVAALSEVSRSLNRGKRSLSRYRAELMQFRQMHGESSSQVSLGRTRYVQRLEEEVLKHEAEYESFLKSTDSLRNTKKIPGLVQMLQVEPLEIRRTLIEILANINSVEASQELARRAIYDLDSGVRSMANHALACRPRQQHRHVLMEGLRYPWPQFARHAAESLVATNDVQATSELIDLLDEPDPSAPFQNEAGDWSVRKLVAVNHLENCLMCHAPSLATSDPVRGLIPTPGEPIPVAYHQNRKGTFVRADITYLQQDFSVMLDVPNAKPWPSSQRFDFLVRTHAVDPPDNDPPTHKSHSFPQREAALFALRKLTGKDAGESSTGWRRLNAKIQNQQGANSKSS